MNEIASFEYTTNPNPAIGKFMRLKLKGGINEQIKFEIQKGQYDELWLNSGNWESLNSLGTLNPKITRLRLYSYEKQNIEWIGNLTSLEYLSVEGKVVGKVDFSRLLNLKHCSLEWSSSFYDLFDTPSKFETLTLFGFSGVLSDLSDAIKSSLLSLSINKGSLQSLDGIENYSRLKELDLDYLRKMTDISCISKTNNLEWLHIGSCNSIKSFSTISSLIRLKKVFIENNSIPSLSIFHPGKHLELISLGEKTVIEDGKTHLALNFPKLKKVSFMNKKFYTKKCREINEELENRSKI